MKKLFIMAITAIMILPAAAQETENKKQSKKELRRQRINEISKQEEEGVIKYKKHTVFGVKLTTDGYGAFFEIGRAQSVKHGLLFQLDIAERKHNKEHKQQRYSNAAPEIYGKINFFYPVKLGVQKQFLLGNKSNKNGVSITGNVGGGFVIGLLRPYMVEVEEPGGTKFISTDDSTYFSQQHIGGPNLGTGWGDMKVTPGLYIKPAVRFDYGKYNEMVSAIEVGLAGEFYTKKIPQIVNVKEQQFFFSAYVSIMFGKRK